MEKRKKNLKIAAVLFGAVLLVAVSSGLWAAPKLAVSKAKPGDCAACHVDKKALPETHPDTKTMDMKACRACHASGEMSLSGKFPGSHAHMLSGVNCAACHGKTKQPEEVPMEKCVACHGSTAKLAEKTKDVKPTNPHTSPHYGTELDCNLCHKQHAKSENYCAQCHKFDYKVP
ncbi:MAG: cytochrome c3 family protein [Smithellaceae bacterium]|nr:cytochrome c3 family protein [Smithellaceae bacterium]